MTTISLDGYKFEYEQRGSGEPLVLVHGSASDYRTWQAQQDRFARHHRTIRYSRRYHWPNEKIAGDADYSMAEHVDDLEALIHSLNAAPAHLVGHSYGAFLCLLLAIQAPELVRTLVLAEPPVVTLWVSNQPKPQELLRLLLTRPRTAVGIAKFGALGLNRAAQALESGDREEALAHFGRATLGPEAFDDLSAERLEQARDNIIDAEVLGSGLLPLEAEDVRQIQAPTLLIGAQDSPPMWDRLMDRLAELLPHAERIEIAGASHIMHEDNAEDYNAAVLSFLDRHGEGSPQPVEREAAFAGAQPA